MILYFFLFGFQNGGGKALEIHKSQPTWQKKKETESRPKKLAVRCSVFFSQYKGTGLLHMYQI